MEKHREKGTPGIKRTHKDEVFRMLFQNPRELLSLYNAVNGTAYENEDELEVVTLENAIYMNVKNDVAFVLESAINLYEHQSTFNPNMPLRDLMYIEKEYSRLIDERKLYLRKMQKIPTPRFLVFYNGRDDQPEKSILRLSDAYERKTETPELELTVTMLNINLGKNRELMEQCEALRGYAVLVHKIRTYTDGGESIDEAVDRAVTECIQAGILKEFLQKNRAEVMAMSLFDYDEEGVMKLIREEEYEFGLEAGRAEGRTAGKTDAVLTLLGELGEVPETLSARIREETGEEKLTGWLKLAARSESMEEFMKNM